MFLSKSDPVALPKGQNSAVSLISQTFSVSAPSVIDVIACISVSFSNSDGSPGGNGVDACNFYVSVTGASQSEPTVLSPALPQSGYGGVVPVSVLYSAVVSSGEVTVSVWGFSQDGGKAVATSRSLLVNSK